MEVIARINADTPTGRKIIRDLARRRVVKLESPMPEELKSGRTYTVEEVFSKVEEKMNEHYGTNYKLEY